MSNVPPAYYAGWRDWYTLLHPPYTLMHLTFVIMGAVLAPELNIRTLLATLLAFFLAVGIAAHALDELAGRPLGTNISSIKLIVMAMLSLAAAASIGIAGAILNNWHILWFVVAGVFLAVTYNLELFGGIFHSDLWFALSWGAFPALTANFAQTEALNLIGLLGATCIFLLALAQRHLSTPARRLRRKVALLEGTIEFHDGSVFQISRPMLLEPLERTLRLLVWLSTMLALTLLILKLMRNEWISGF